MALFLTICLLTGYLRKGIFLNIFCVIYHKSKIEVLIYVFISLSIPHSRIIKYDIAVGPIADEGPHKLN